MTLPKWITHHLPMRRKTLLAQMKVADQRLEALRQQHAREIRECQKAVERIVDRAVNIKVRRERDIDPTEFAVLIRFRPYEFGMGFHEREGIRMIAAITGRRVEAEIASSKFLQSAYDLERETYQRQVRDRPTAE